MARTPTPEDRERLRRRPDRKPVLYQKWEKLLFLHWRLDPSEIAKTLPPGLEVDTYDGSAWLGLVPFFMKGIRPRFLPAVPGISNFLEMNVRTYVHDAEGRPGVWFYSLDAAQSLGVSIGRCCFHLPYFRADMTGNLDGSKIHYTCDRRGEWEKTRSEFTYSGGEELPAPPPGSLEYFLVERYLLFSHRERDGALFSGQVHHVPYTIQSAVVDHYEECATSQAGFDIGGREPDHAIYSEKVEVDVFAVESVPSP